MSHVCVCVPQTLFQHNSAKYGGGAVYLYGKSAANIINSTFTQNNAGYGRANGGAIFVHSSQLVRICGNVLIWCLLCDPSCVSHRLKARSDQQA